jgi:hypothetical protein
MLDLYNNRYDYKTLKENIYALKLIDIIKTQILNERFIVHYILSDLYQLHEEDKGITIECILKYQPHIDEDILTKMIDEYNSDDDSVEDFESISNKDK